MKTINIACSYASKYGGNFIPSILSLANEISKNNKVIFSFPETAKDRNWCHYLQEKGYLVNFFRAETRHEIQDIKKINKANKVDLIYTHFISTPIVKLLSPFSKKLKMVIHVHSDFSAGVKNKSLITKIKKALFTNALRKDAKYIYVSKSMMEQEKTMNSIYVRNALCLDRIPCKKLNKEEVLKRIKKKKGDIVFLAFGWSPKVKGIDITVKAFLEARQSFTQGAKLLIVCDDNGVDKCLSYLKNEINYDQKDDDIYFLNPSEDVFSYYELADVFISSSRSEGFSYSLLESLYFGLEALVSDIDSTLWSKQYNAKIYGVEDYKKLSELMVSLTTSEIKKTPRLSIKNEYLIDKWVSEISEILK